MKRILLPLLALALVACGNQSGQNRQDDTLAGQEDSLATNPTDVADDIPLKEPRKVDLRTANLAVVERGENGESYLSLLSQGDWIRISDEGERVFNCAFVPGKPEIYYTCSTDGFQPYLKLAVLGQEKVLERRTVFHLDSLGIADFNQLYEGQTDRCSTMEVLPSGEVLLPYTYTGEFNKAVLINLEDRSVKLIMDYQGPVAQVLSGGLDPEPIPQEGEGNGELYVNGQNQLMYKGVCLSDALDIQPYKGTEQLRYILPSLSPSGEKIVFGVQTNRENPQHGVFCIANTDGTQQEVLHMEGANFAHRPQWMGERAVYFQYNVVGKDENGYVLRWKFLYSTTESNRSIQLMANIGYWCVR